MLKFSVESELTENYSYRKFRESAHRKMSYARLVKYDKIYVHIVLAEHFLQGLSRNEIFCTYHDCRNFLQQLSGINIFCTYYCRIKIFWTYNYFRNILHGFGFQEISEDIKLTENWLPRVWFHIIHIIIVDIFCWDQVLRFFCRTLTKLSVRIILALWQCWL